MKKIFYLWSKIYVDILCTVCVLALVGGCATICQTLTPTQLSQAEATMKSLQDIYETNVAIWKIDKAPDVQEYAAAIYLALDVVGEMLATGCENHNGLINAQKVAGRVR